MNPLAYDLAAAVKAFRYWDAATEEVLGAPTSSSKLEALARGLRDAPATDDPTTRRTGSVPAFPALCSKYSLRLTPSCSSVLCRRPPRQWQLLDGESLPSLSTGTVDRADASRPTTRTAA